VVVVARDARRVGRWQAGRVEWTFPEPALRSDEIVLRSLRPDDASAVVEACRDPAIGRFTFMQEGLKLDDALGWIDDANRQWGSGSPRFAVADATSDRFLGQIGMAVDEAYQRAEMFYWVIGRERGRGVASAALALMCDWAFDNALERLFLVVSAENEASHRVAARCGFTREGVLRGYERFKGSRPDVVSWSLLSTDPRIWRDEEPAI
jgi:ribosomal-protein-alanine N-acetyltransferase